MHPYSHIIKLAIQKIGSQTNSLNAIEDDTTILTGITLEPKFQRIMQGIKSSINNNII
jgi:hypothetical protein